MQIRLKDVRLAFPNLFEARAASEAAQPKFSAAFIFPPDHVGLDVKTSPDAGWKPVDGSAAEAITKLMLKLAKDKWAGKAEAIVKQLKASDKLALHDGDVKAQYAGYEGNLFINANNALRPRLVDRDGSPVSFADNKLYSGAYVNAIIELWAQDNKHGKRINGSLLGVQFSRDGERLAGGMVASEDDFEALPDEVDPVGGESDDDGLAGIL